MKKIIRLAIVLLCIGMLAGCGSKADGGTDAVQMKDGNTLQTVVDRIEDEVGIQMSADIDDQLFTDLFYIDPETDVEEYAGKMAMSMTSADNVVAVKAKPESRQKVLDGLNKRLADVQASFEQYLPDQYEKSQRGLVIEKGDYLFLLIVGETSEDQEKAQEIIAEAF